MTGPKLLTVTHNGKPIDIVAQATKFGLLYVFDRVTGKPLWPIEERPVPQSDVPGEQSSPTQPFPTRPAPFSRLKFTEADVNPYLDEARARSASSGFSRTRAMKASSRRSASRRIRFPFPASLAAPTGAAPPPIPRPGMLYVRSADQPALHAPLQPVENSDGDQTR